MIKKIIVHCSDSDHDHHDDISVIREWHIARGFSDVGYHYFIQKNGNIQKGRAENVMGAHVRGYNRDSLGVCLHGKNTFTKEQFQALKNLVEDIRTRYNLKLSDVYGHRDFDNKKTCPNFDVQEKMREPKEQKPQIKSFLSRLQAFFNKITSKYLNQK